MKHQTQLCRQIKEALEPSIPTDLMLDLIDVVPGNSNSHFIVIFKPVVTQFDVEGGYKQLESLREELYDEVCADISRRRVPDLTFKIAPIIDWERIRAS